MCVITVFVLLATGLKVTAETHSLMYTYTAFSKPVGLPGVHTFTAMGLLDDIIIDYYDSESQKKVPKQDCMNKSLLQPYWVEGTEARQAKQKWFKENIEILMDRMKQNSSDIHVLQWRHGCEAEKQTANGSLKFTRGIDMYSYDGKDFISFDATNKVWVAVSLAAEQTKRKWDNEELIQYTIGYLQNNCIGWLRAFMKCREEQLVQAAPPKVLMFAKNSKFKKNVVLTCLATGFLPKYIELNIKREGRVLIGDDGVYSTGPLPNGDDTFQRRDNIEIFRDDLATFTCEVSHSESNLHINITWDKTEESGNLQAIGWVSGGLFMLPVAAVVLLILYQRNIGFSRK
ncbi:H-2 class I histocompatibility antigen, Q9 alpha chain-like [Labrus mixtus]|uniref:H-2 class I histocompatibility antigen, Q9 alpha chain-like n=1 Tax=Labrus mixtus TaxID=508554 RepID=UPI0029C0D553|nr:H-2 class I histocompatibility antigen, Q9 alpha chain-like [Labrus mixtus]